MKPEAVVKINQMGMVAGIITLIAKIIIGIGIVGVLIATIALAALPKDFVKATIRTGATIYVDLSQFGNSFSKEGQKEMKKSLTKAVENGTIDMNGITAKVSNIEVDDKGFSLDADGQTEAIPLKKISVFMIGAWINLIVTMVTLWFVGALCKAIKNCDSPFSEDVIRKMKHFAYSLIPWCVISSVANSAMSSFWSDRWDFNLAVNGNMVAVVLVVLALTYIFQYGAVLQQESDETL